MLKSLARSPIGQPSTAVGSALTRLPAMSLEWTEDGSGGRSVSAPLKFKISVSQLHLSGVNTMHASKENVL